MNTRQSARNVRAISRLAGVLEQQEISVWLGGDWGRKALDDSHQTAALSADFYLYADDAPDVRRITEELGYGVIDITPSCFTVERGSLTIVWHQLWYEESGYLVSFDERDRPFRWPSDAFAAEFRGVLAGVPVRIVDPEAEMLHSALLTRKNGDSRKRGDVAKVKAIIHDRM